MLIFVHFRSCRLDSCVIFISVWHTCSSASVKQPVNNYFTRQGRTQAACWQIYQAWCILWFFMHLNKYLAERPRLWFTTTSTSSSSRTLTSCTKIHHIKILVSVILVSFFPFFSFLLLDETPPQKTTWIDRLGSRVVCKGSFSFQQVIGQSWPLSAWKKRPEMTCFLSQLQDEVVKPVSAAPSEPMSRCTKLFWGVHVVLHHMNGDVPWQAVCVQADILMTVSSLCHLTASLHQSCMWTNKTL